MDHLNFFTFLHIVKSVRLLCILRMKIKTKKLKFNPIINYRKNNQQSLGLCLSLLTNWQIRR